MAAVHRGRVGRHAGGILGVLTLLYERPGAVTADLRRHYGMSLREAICETPTRELLDLLEWIPPRDSAIAREVNGELLAMWTPADENLALIVDSLRNWLQFLWSQWTATEAERKRRTRGRAPKTPPLLPYAIRPPEINDAVQAEHDRVAGIKPRELKPGDRNGMRKLSIEELARIV